MNRAILFTFLAAVALVATPARAIVPTSFSYTQTDAITGSGTIAAFTYNDGGGDITFSPTPITAAVVNPVPGMTAAGFVGAMNAQSGAANEANQAVGVVFSGSATATGTRGAQTYTMQVPLKFVPKVTQSPTDLSDYTWDILYGDSPANGVDAATTANIRFAMWFSRDNVIDAAETPATFQRYTQLTQGFVSGTQDSYTNNTTSANANVKDAMDAGAPAGTDAEGRDLAFYYGWRDTGTLSGGAILIDTFTVAGLLNGDETTLVLVPEPSSALLLLGVVSSGLFLRRRRATNR